MNNNIKIYRNIEQRSAEWHSLRLGLITGSQVHRLMGVKGLGQTGLTYIDEIISEILTGKETEIADNKYLEHGRTYEPIARKLFEKALGLEFEEVGFVKNSDFKYCGSSPDGLILSEKIGLEIKCPYKSANHKSYLMFKNQNDLKESKKEYYWQILFLMLISKLEKVWFVSYHPDFTKLKDLRLFALPIYYNQTDIDFLTERVNEASFLIENDLKALGVFELL